MARWSEKPVVAYAVLLAFGGLGWWWAWYYAGGPQALEARKSAGEPPVAWRLAISGPYRAELTSRTRIADRLVRTALVTRADYRHLAAVLDAHVDTVLMPIRMTDPAKTEALSVYRSDCLEYLELGASLLNAMAAVNEGRASAQQHQTARALADQWPNINRNLAEKRRRAEKDMP